MEQTLINPVGSKYVYSDLSMITGMYVVGHLARTLGKIKPNELRYECSKNLSHDSPEIAQCYYEAYAVKEIFNRVPMRYSKFLPPETEWGLIAPTWNDTYYRHEIVQGQVSDENSYALGGIAGHAGLFSNVGDVIEITRRLMWAPENSDFVNRTTWAYFSTIQNVTQSSRALGWDTNNYKMNTYRGCGNLSSSTWTHTGYTGTEICGDPVRRIVTILLTNRVYPDKTSTANGIHRARQNFNNAVRAVVDSQTFAVDYLFPAAEQ